MSSPSFRHRDAPSAESSFKSASTTSARQPAGGYGLQGRAGGMPAGHGPRVTGGWGPNRPGGVPGGKLCTTMLLLILRLWQKHMHNSFTAIYADSAVPAVMPAPPCSLPLVACLAGSRRSYRSSNVRRSTSSRTHDMVDGLAPIKVQWTWPCAAHNSRQHLSAHVDHAAPAAATYGRGSRCICSGQTYVSMLDTTQMLRQIP